MHMHIYIILLHIFIVAPQTEIFKYSNNLLHIYKFTFLINKIGMANITHTVMQNLHTQTTLSGTNQCINTFLKYKYLFLH